MAHNFTSFIDTQNVVGIQNDLVQDTVTPSNAPQKSVTREILDTALEQHKIEYQKKYGVTNVVRSPSEKFLPGIENSSMAAAYRITYEQFESMVKQQLLVTVDMQRKYATEANQKSSQWLEVKERRLTSSQFGSAAEHNTYETMTQLLAKKLWPKPFNNKFMAYGSKYEAVANYVFQKFMRCNAATLLDLRKTDPRTTVLTPEQALKRFRPDPQTLQAFRDYEVESVEHHNLKQSDKESQKENLTVPYDEASTPVTALQVVVSRTPGEEYLGFSPDGVVLENGQLGGLEIKCPSSTKQIPNYIPHAHYDQMQGTMYISGFTFYYYVVYTPEYTLVRKLVYDKHYCESILVPCFRNFFKHYMRALYYKHCGLLKDGEISPAVTL